MQLQWRSKEYKFDNKKLAAFRDKDGPRARPTIDAPIYGADTESVKLPDRYEPQCFQVSGSSGDYIRYLPERAKALEFFLMELWARDASTLFDNKRAFIYFHNLIYDWLQLIKLYPDLVKMARTGIGLNIAYPIFENGFISVTLEGKGLFSGTAAHFDLLLKERKHQARLMFRDTHSFFPSTLDKITKELGLTPKLKRPENIGKIDYRPFPEDHPERLAFEAYALVDAIGTRETGEKIRYLHQSAGMKKIRISAPGYAITKLFHSMPEDQALYAGTNDPATMQLIVDAYGGGRTGGVFHGYIENLWVFDYHSSYPASMLTLPSFTGAMEYFDYPTPNSLTIPELLEFIDQFHCFIELDGFENDGQYPALIQSKGGKLYPVYGEFHNVKTTGVELSVGIKSGTLIVTKIHKLVILIENQENPYLAFREFVLDAYSRKATAEKDSPEYISAKLELNSSYGKLIESHDINRVDVDTQKYILPYMPGAEAAYGQIYYEAYLKTFREDAGKDFESIIDEIIQNFIDPAIGGLPPEYQLADFGYLALSNREYGHYVIPAAAALITGTSRARLVTAMRASSALYWDTDSVFIPKPKDLTKDQFIEQLKEKFRAASDWLPKFIQPVTIGDALGEMGSEIEDASGYLAGTKRYYIETPCIYPDPKKPGEFVSKVKQALHGIPTAPYTEAAAMIEALATGSNYCYTGRERPLTAKDAKTADEIGEFRAGNYESCFTLDDRLTWVETDNGWTGTIKEFVDL